MAKNPELCIAEFGLAERLEYNADSVEWCPFPQWAQFLVCGTYHLNETKTEDATQTRDGNIVLYKLATDINDTHLRLDKVSVVDTGGILDMKWCPELINCSAVLGVAGSDGTISLLALSPEKETTCLETLAKYNLSKMVLSLDWSTQQERSLALVASDSGGDLSHFVMRESEICLLGNWNAHQFEAWITAWDYSQPNVVYSGGDDCCFKCWDIRSSSSPIFINRRHSMGVTAISKSKRNEHLLVTGSYDANVFLWDIRSTKTPVSEIFLDGGIWRLKWHPNNSAHLLSASMHNGFHVLSIKDEKLNLEAHYDLHESLAYGVDWCYLSSPKNTFMTGENVTLKSDNCNQNLVASCSFYDKVMHIWRINL